MEEEENKVRVQEKACEAMRGERNQAAKSLLDAQQELDGLRRKHTLLVRSFFRSCVDLWPGLVCILASMHKAVAWLL